MPQEPGGGGGGKIKRGGPKKRGDCLRAPKRRGDRPPSPGLTAGRGRAATNHAGRLAGNWRPAKERMSQTSPPAGPARKWGGTAGRSNRRWLASATTKPPNATDGGPRRLPSLPARPHPPRPEEFAAEPAAGTNDAARPRTVHDAGVGRRRRHGRGVAGPWAAGREYGRPAAAPAGLSGAAVRAPLARARARPARHRPPARPDGRRTARPPREGGRGRPRSRPCSCGRKPDERRPPAPRGLRPECGGGPAGIGRMGPPAEPSPPSQGSPDAADRPRPHPLPPPPRPQSPRHRPAAASAPPPRCCRRVCRPRRGGRSSGRPGGATTPPRGRRRRRHPRRRQTPPPSRPGRPPRRPRRPPPRGRRPGCLCTAPGPPGGGARSTVGTERRPAQTRRVGRAGPPPGGLGRAGWKRPAGGRAGPAGRGQPIDTARPGGEGDHHRTSGWPRCPPNPAAGLD
ncbi:hypothetical protein SHIRM173S_00514 [Streptomyces hirsutus]